MRLADTTVLLTGASGGIGRALALELARRGARLMLTARDASKLEELRRDVVRNGGTATIVAADLTSSSDRDRVVSAAQKFGVDVLINNAGSNHLGLFADQDAQSIERLIACNVLAPMQLTRQMLAHLVGRQRACIVNVGSILGSIATPGQTTYSATKFAIHGFSEGLRRELAADGIKVIYVAPRATDTAMNDEQARDLNERLGIAMDPVESVALEIVAAMVRGRSERYIGWPEKLFVRINALFPALVDKALGKQRKILNETQVPTDALALSTGVKQ